MADDIIKVRIEADMDFSAAKEQLVAAGKEIRGMKEEMADMPNVSRLFNSSLEKTASIIDSVSGKVETLRRDGFEDEDKKARFIQGGNESIKDANVMHGLQVGSSAYGVQIAREWFKGLPQAVQREFDAITPRITAILRSRMSSLTKDGIHFTGSNVEALTSEMLSDKEVQKLIRSSVHRADQKQVEGYIQRIIPNAVAHNRLSGWQEARYGSAMLPNQDAMIQGKPETLFPDSYVSSFKDAHGYRRTTLSEEQSRKVLTKERFSDLGKVFAKYPIAVRAAIASGIARRDDRGVLETRRDLTMEDWEGMREALYNELENRATGAGSKRIDIYGSNPKTQRDLARRLTSSSAGQAMLAMHAVEAMSKPEAWVDKTTEAGYVKQQTEARRVLDRYATLKYSPFLQHGDWDKNPYAKENGQFVMIPESQNTKLLGQGKWQNNQDISGTVALISLAGYNPEDKKQFETLRDLYAHGKVIDGVDMVAQSTHGNGDTTTIRMVARSEMERVEREEQEWARKNGFSGSYFQNYTDAQRAEMAAYDAAHPGSRTLSEKVLGKQYDAENKGWSPSADMGLNLAGKRFAVVDLGGEGDGSAWMSSSVMPYANQARFGIAGKGSVFTYNAANNREFARNAGFLDDQGRWMARGLNGEMYDIAGYDGIIPADTVKNLLAYGHVDQQSGEFVYGKAYTNKNGQTVIDTSNEAISEMMTAALQRYGPRAIANYEQENTNSNRLGTQMTSFMALSPELRAHQAEMYAQRMRELDTEEGQLRYVFTNPEEDWVAKQVHENRQLLATPTAQKRVDDYRASLQQNIAAGQYIDFGQSDTKISDIRLADNPLRSLLAATTDETTRANVLSKMRNAMSSSYDRKLEALTGKGASADEIEAFKQGHKRDYTDQELLDLINLSKNANEEERIIDFAHMNQDHVGVLRSPTGYGNMVYAQNIASEIAPIFDAFKMSRTGVFVSKEALETLQSADYDGDRAKIVTGELASAVKRTREAYEEQMRRIKGADTSIKTEAVKYDADLTDDPTQRALAAERNVKEVQLMGGSSGGVRAMQLDLSNSINNPYIIAQKKMQAMYDANSIFHKNPVTVDLNGERQYWDTLKLGREFTKFTDKASDLFEYDPDQLDKDNKLKADAKDIFRSSNGQAINMRRLKDMKIDETNLPSINMDAHLMGVGQTRGIYLAGGSDTTRWDAIAEALSQLEYPEGAGEKTKALMSTMRQMFPQFGSGARGSISREETADLRTKIAEAEAELGRQAEEGYQKGFGIYQAKHGDKVEEYKSKKEFIEKEGRRYGIFTAKNAVDVFGLTQDRLERKFGTDAAKALENDPSISAMNDAVVESVVEEAQETAKAAAEEITKTTKSKAGKGGKGGKGKSKKTSAKAITDSENEPPEMIKCGICGIVYPASLGECPNTANHSTQQNAKQTKRDQSTLSNIQKAEVDPNKTFEENFSKVLNGFAGVESSKAIAEKMMESFDDTIKGHRRTMNANKEQTAADRFFGIETWKRDKAHKDFDWAAANLDKSVFGEGTAMREAARERLDQLDSGYVSATRQWASDNSKNIVEGMRKSVTGVGDEFDRQQAQVEAYSNAIKELESTLENFQKSRAKLAKEAADNGSFIPESVSKKDAETVAQMQKDLAEAQALREQGIQNIQTKNNQSFMDKADSLYNQMYGKTASPLERIDRQVSTYQDTLATEMARLETAKEKDKITEEDYLARKKQFEGLQEYASTTLKDDLYNREFDKIDKQTSRMATQSDRLSRQRKMRASMSPIARFMMQNESEYQQREQMQSAMKTRMDELIEARDGRLDEKTGKRVGGMSADSKEYARATAEINKLSQAMEQNEGAMQSLTGASGALNAVFSSVGITISRFAQRLGRQLFQKALTEAKKFVQEFNKSMTTIQMITLKSDDQMSKLGDGLISKAKELKISISEITQSAATLYRQGLSDEEVDERLEIISKFSKVSGTKVDAATKLITVAMNTGLVNSPQMAADIVTALGDNAATNAAEIEKGIEKAGAAAAADGTTFGQLAAMLTAITSTTQIGGSTAGRTLNTIFGRMNKIGTNELIYDENGEAISGSAVAKLLSAQGIEQYENGKKKSSYDTLYELSQKWDTMSDAEQQQIATAIAGTRQYSNFAAIMQGMSEGKVDEYMNLVGSSTGITDQKYEIYTQSLEAALTNLKNTFDELIKDLTNNGTLTGVINTLSSMIQGVDNLTKSMGPLGAALTTVIPLLAGLTMMKVGLTTGSWQIGLAGLGVAAVGGIIASTAGGQSNEETANDIYTKTTSVTTERLNNYSSNIARVKELRDLGSSRTSAQNTEYRSLLMSLAKTSGTDLSYTDVSNSTKSASGSLDSLAESAKNLGEAAEGAVPHIENYADRIIENADKDKDNREAVDFYDKAAAFGAAVSETIEQADNEFTQGVGIQRLTPLFSFDPETQSYYIRENAHKNLTGKSSDSGSVKEYLAFNPSETKQSFGTVFAEALKAPDISYNIPSEYINKSTQYWEDYFNSGGISGGPEDLPEEVLQAVVDFWNASSRMKTRSSNIEETGISKIKEMLNNEEYAFIPEEYKSALPALIYGNLPVNEMTGLPDTSPTAIKYAFWNVAGLSDETDTSKLTTKDIIKNISASVNTSTLSTNSNYTLEDVGANGYYIDESGKRWSSKDVEEYYNAEQETDKSRAIKIMQAHNAKVKTEYDEEVKRITEHNDAETARVEAEQKAVADRLEQEAETKYQDDLLAEAKRLSKKDGHGTHMDQPAILKAYARDVMLHQGLIGEDYELTDEDVRRYSKNFVNETQALRDKYITEYGNPVEGWEFLTPEDKDKYLKLAKASVQRHKVTEDEIWEASTYEEPDFWDIPELDESKLVGGAKATTESLGKLYDEGKVLSEVAEEIDEAAEEVKNGQHVFKGVKNSFVDAMSNYTSGKNAWATKNAAGISADNISSLLISEQFGNGKTGLDAFMNYVNSNAAVGSDWSTLMQNSPELQHVMHQAVYDKNTGTFTYAPDDIMDQIARVVKSGSLIYGSAYLTTEQKGKLAQTAYEGLTTQDWFLSQEQKDKAQDEAWEKYKEDILSPYKNQIAKINAQEGVPQSVKERMKAEIRASYGNPFETKEAFLETRSDLNTAAMSTEQPSYLKDALGEQMYTRVLDASSGGKALTESEQKYIQTVLNNRVNGLTNLTTGQQLQGVKDVRAAISSGTFVRDVAADQYMSQWSGWSEYAALLSKRSSGALTAEDEERIKVLENALENFQENTEIKFKLEGVQELENAGKIASGVTSEIEKLRKGGKVALEIITKYKTEGYESGQQTAKLLNGSVSQQDEAAMAILGMSKEQYYANRDINYQAAISSNASNVQYWADTWTTRYNNAKTNEQRDAISEAAKLAGYNMETRASYGANGLTSNAYFAWNGSPELTNIGSLVGEQRTYTEAERNAALDQILSGALVRVAEGEGANTELFDTAVGSAGENTRELLRRWQNSETDLNFADWLNSAQDIPEWLKSASASERREYQWSRYGSMYSTRSQETAARNALAGDWRNEENISSVASYLGMDESRVRQMMETGRSEELSSLISEKADAAFDAAKEELSTEFPELQFNSSNWEELVTEIEAAAETADGELKDRLLAYRDALIDGAKVLTPEKAIEKYSSWGKNQLDAASITTIKGLVTEGMTWDQLKAQIIGDNKTFKTDSDFENFLSRNTNIAEILDQARTQGFTPEVMNLLTQASPEAVLNADKNYQEQYSKWLGLSNGLGGINVNTLKSLTQEDSAFRSWLDGFENLEDALKDTNGMLAGSSTAFKKLHNEMYSGLLKSLKPWGDQTDEIVDSGKAAMKSISGQAEAAKNLRKTLTDISDNQTSRERIRSGKKIDNETKSYFESLGFDKKDIKKAKDNKSVLDALALDEEADKERLSKELTSYFVGLGEAVSEAAMNNEIEVPGLNVHVDGGQITMDTQQLLNTFGSMMTDTQRQLIETALAAGVQMQWDVTSTGNGVAFTPRVTKLGSGTRSSAKKGSGGGGGKTKTDSLIEGQSHYIKRREHDVNMAQERETRYEKTNNYQGYLNALNDEIAAQERLKGQYAANIEALKEQLSTLKEGSEEWYKCQEAIDSAEEAMAKIDNEIDNINSKKINITETKQANEDKPISHASTMLKLKAESYLEKGQFENYAAVTKAQIANYANDIQLNNKQLEEWEDLLKTYEEGTQDWMNVRDKVWAIKEENAELENNMLKETHELQKATIAQIATDLQNAMAPIEHEQNMLNTWGGIYQKGRQYGAYRSALTSQNAYNEGQAALYQSSITELQKQMKTLEVGSQAWLDARAAIFEYQEALASVTASIQENDSAIEESYVSEITEHYQDASKSAEHELKMAQIAAERYKSEGDYKNYENMLNVQRDLIGNRLSTERDSLAEMEALFNGGTLKEGSDQWKALREQIMSLRETVTQTENDYASMVRQVRETKFENAVEQFNTKDNEVQHEIKMVQYDETKYQNAGELTNYGKALEYDNGLQQKRADLISKQIDLLEKQRDAAKDDPQLYNKIDAEIMKMEEQLANTNNTIEKNNKLIEKNQEAIRKLQQNIENTLDKEIKAREKLERDMLAGTITSQNSMLEVIKKRYQDEFNLVKKDIENKKKALNEEKSLINERLNARKKAIDEEDKYETLAEYQKQLAIISADPTRSKDAKELRRKIADLQKEISWTIAEEETKAATDALDDQIKALDDYVQVASEDLTEMLKDSNNFADELNRILGGSFENYVEWMKENSETYKNATAETRKQMEQGWHDTWLKMKGETETYWEDVASLMQNKNDFLTFMKQSQEYINASASGKASLEYQWSQAFDDYQASLIDNATFGDNHDVLQKMSEMKDWTYKVEPVVDPSYDYGLYSTAIEYWYARQKDNTAGIAQNAIDQSYDQYSSVVGSQASLYESQRKKEEESSVPQITIEVSSGGSGGGGGNKNTTTVTPTQEKNTVNPSHYWELYFNGKQYSGDGYSDRGSAYSAAEQKKRALAQNLIDKGYPSTAVEAIKANARITAYKNGGLIDFTGPAWVDGSPSQPEGILSAYDTKAIQALTDVLTHVYVRPGYTPSSDYFKGNTNIGDINVTINQAELKDDADFEDVAKRVGRAFTKQLNKEGFNLSRYAF